MRKLLITGAMGRVGRYAVSRLGRQYELLTTDRHEPENGWTSEYIRADIGDFEAMYALCRQVDTVVHLAANASIRAEWHDLLAPNVVGVYTVFEAACRAGCRRVVYASTINAVIGYPEGVQVKTNMPPMPGNLYGATKAWGEMLAAYYSSTRNLSVHCIRFGGVSDDPRRQRQKSSELRRKNIRITYNDAVRLIEASIEAPEHMGFGVFHGLSPHEDNRLDMSDTWKVLGIEPAMILGGRPEAPAGVSALEK